MPDATLMSGISRESDPSALTTDQLRREIGHLRELVFTRLDGMDQAIVIFQENITRVPTDVDKQVGHLRSLTDEKLATLGQRFDRVDEHFKGIESQFILRDRSAEKTERDNKTAIDAALLAQKEAVTKQEMTTTKQIDGIGQTIQTAKVGQDAIIGDLKDRLARQETLILNMSNEIAGMKTERRETVVDHSAEERAKTQAQQSVEMAHQAQQAAAASRTIAMVSVSLGSLIGIVGIVMGLMGK